METEIVYLGHDNSIDLIIKNNDTAIDLSGITRVTMSFGTFALDSTNGATQMIHWNQIGYVTGEMRIKMGLVNASTTKVLPGSYQAPVILYDTSATEGVVWGEIPIIVKAEIEGTT